MAAQSDPMDGDVALQPEEVVRAALRQLKAGGSLAVLDALPYPVYATDPDGFVTSHNRACADFAGRTPRVGEDRWCVTWKLYTAEGAFLPHEACPMAVALKSRRPVRGVTALAQRPDGRRVAFAPFPTPLLDGEGRLVGAVNVFLPLPDAQETARIRDQAARARRLAKATLDRQTLRALNDLADEYDAKARAFSPQ